MARKVAKNISPGTAVASLILNIAIPGVGTLLSRRTKEGLWQLFLWVIAMVLLLDVFSTSAWLTETGQWYIGTVIVIAVYLWAILRGIWIVMTTFK